jgi:hypothetical protein
MQKAVMKDIVSAASALRQASASVKQLAQCRYCYHSSARFAVLALIPSQAGRVGPLERAAHDGAVCGRRGVAPHVAGYQR